MEGSEIFYDSWIDWNPKEYLRTYFSKLEDDEEATIQFLVKHLKEVGYVNRVLEFGSGPMVIHSLPLVPYTKEIHIADYLSSNLAEVEYWVKEKEGYFDQALFTSRILELEGKDIDTGSVKKRENDLRRIIKTLTCDASVFPAIEIGPELYPLIVSIFCVDSATDSKSKWEEFMSNIINHLAQDGHFIFSALRKATSYKVGNRKFPSANIDENTIMDFLTKQGFAKESIKIEVANVPFSEPMGYNSIILGHIEKVNH